MTLTLPWDMDFTSFISFEDDLLDFHRIEELVGLRRARKGHDILGHESDTSLAKTEVKNHASAGAFQKMMRRRTLVDAGSSLEPPTLPQKQT